MTAILSVLWGRIPRLGDSSANTAEAKAAQAAVRKAEEKYRSLFENSVLGIFQSTRDGHYLSANPAMARIYGYDSPEHLVSGLIDIGKQHYINPQRRKQLVATLDSEGTVSGFEAEIRRTDGSHRWISKRARVVRDEQGIPLYYEGTVEDITEAKAAQAAVRKAEEKYRSLFENSVLGIFQSTRDGHYLSANPAMARIYGYDSPEHLVSGLIDIGKQHYINPQRRKQLVATLDSEGTVSGFEAEIRRTDGSHRWISKRARVVRDEQGNPLYYEGTVEDITEAKAAQAAVQKAKEEADQARAAAEAASVAKSQFLANMSHEIRTPLNGVIGIADLMIRKGGLTEQQNQYAKVIKSSGDSLLSLINDILDFSKIEAGKLELSPIEFDFRSAIEDVVEMLTPKADAKNLALACHISRSVPARMIGDPDRIRQNLINLVNNAIKFTSAGHVLIRAAVESQDPAHCVVKFVVEDSGAGIPSDRLNRLFKSFSQVDASTTRKYGGTGLGLAIVKELSTLMGGEVGVESVVGQGSSFWFTVRLAGTTQPPGGSSNPSDLAAAMRSMRALIVDDQPAYLEVIREQLAAWDVVADVCTTTDQAMQKLQAAAEQKSPYAVALVDLVIPSCDVSAFLRKVTRDSRFATTAFRLMTSMDSGTGEALTKELGLTACLHKPIRHSTLFDMLADAVACKLSSVRVERSAPVKEAGKIRAHVLLAEDNEVNQEVASGILLDAGCTVEIVCDGVKALEAAIDPSKRFDIVLMDCMMPEMDGFEATRRIRLARGSALPIIALTANAIAGDRELCLQAGMTDYVTKPVDPDLLLETIKKLLKQKPSAAADEAIAAPTPSATPPTQPGVEESAVSNAVPIDADALLRRCRGKEDLAGKLLNMFTSSVDQQLADLRAALGKAEWETFTRLAHTIKGTGANLSASTVSRVAGDLEQLGKSADASAAREVLTKLESEVKACIAFIPSALKAKSRADQKSATIR